MNKEERDFARLQIDIQMLITICLAFVALAGAFLIAFSQTNNNTFAFLTILMGLFGIGCAVGAIVARKKMDEPKIAKTKLQNELMLTTKPHEETRAGDTAEIRA